MMRLAAFTVCLCVSVFVAPFVDGAVLHMRQTVTVTEVDKNDDVMTDENDYLKCLVDCMGLSFTAIGRLLDKCQGDLHCWEKELGPKAAACLVQCALNTQLPKDEVVPDQVNDYMKCLADCLDLSATKIAQLIDKCHSDVHCWQKELGPKAAACLVTCALTKELPKLQKVEAATNDYMKCLADCLDLSATKIAQLIDKCHSDVHCWEKELGPKAAACLVSCALGKQLPRVTKPKAAATNDYMKCLADCLDLSVTKIAQLIDKCHSDVHCWEKELGPKAAACLVTCALTKQLPQLKHVDAAATNDYMKCLADCLDLSVTKIAQLIDKCHSDMHCWEKELGPKAAACLVSCAISKPLTGVSIQKDAVGMVEEMVKMSHVKISSGDLLLLKEKTNKHQQLYL